MSIATLPSSGPAKRLGWAAMTRDAAVVGLDPRRAWIGPGKLFRTTMRAGFAPVPLPWPFHTIQRVAQSLDRAVWDLVRDRKGHPTDSPDLLNYLLCAESEDGHRLPDKRVRDESLTFMLAGHETTANGLQWMWYLLALNPQARERMFAEVDEVLAGRTPTADDLPRLPWTTACFLEALRYFSPAWVIPRVAAKSDSIGGHRIRKGTTVILPAHAVHHDPRWWDRPEVYGPSRFLPGALKLGHPVDPEATLTLRPRYGLRVIARRRRVAA